MGRKVWQNGDIFYAEDANAIAYPIVDGADFIGHGPKVIDDYLSDESTHIKSRFYSFYDRLKVSHQSGLALDYLGGALLLSNGAVVSITPGTIYIPDNSTSYVFVNNSGVVQSSTVLPNECFPLALVITSGGTVSLLSDLRDKIIDRVSPATIPTQQLIPPGTGMDFWGPVLPAGWIWADGSLYPITQYPALFAAIGYTYGGGDGQFRVPDKRGRVSIGAGQGSELSNRTIGQIFGEEFVTLNISQIPSHTHGVNDPGHAHALNDPGHAHGVNDPGHSHLSAGADPGGNLTGSNGNTDRDNFFHFPTSPSLTGISIFGARTGISVSGAGTGISLSSQGGGGAHNNMQPSIVCNYIIKW